MTALYTGSRNEKKPDRNLKKKYGSYNSSILLRDNGYVEHEIVD